MGKALRLETFLKQNYLYDANSIFNSQQNTPLDRFLFETKAGHCEFFASALAVMLRSQGITSRLVTDFSATTMNPLTGYYEIYSLGGHTWVEAWFDGKGWMLLEAIPPYVLPHAETETVTAKQLQKYVEELQRSGMKKCRHWPSYGRSRQISFGHSFSIYAG
jgi:transglutaminase-like putative cysteine protease